MWMCSAYALVVWFLLSAYAKPVLPRQLSFLPSIASIFVAV
jgi:hypothetical protein